MKKIILFSIFTFVVNILSAQSQSIHKQLEDKNIQIKRDYAVNTVIDETARKYQKDGIIGYKIQIYSNDDRTEAIRLERLFKQKFSEYKIKLEYEIPNFRLRVGNFRNKIEAQKLYHQIKKDEDFKAVLIVKTKIDFPKLD